MALQQFHKSPAGWEAEISLADGILQRYAIEPDFALAEQPPEEPMGD